MNKNILLVLDETERSLITESLHNKIKYGFPYYFFNKKFKKYHDQNIELLEKLNTQSGGFSLKVTEDNIYFICDSLRWNGKFILSDAQRNTRYIDEYSKLSFILEGRSKNIDLFSDFDPKHYTLNNQLKPFKKFNFKENRILLVRFEKEKMEFIREFYKNDNENDEQYSKRAGEAVAKENADCIEGIKYNNKFLEMEYKAVLFTDLVNHQVKEDFSYHC